MEPPPITTFQYSSSPTNTNTNTNNTNNDAIYSCFLYSKKRWTRWMQFLERSLESHYGHLFILSLVLFDLIFVFVEIMLLILACETQNPNLTKYANHLSWVSMGFFILFVLENLLRMTSLGERYFQSFWNLFDFATVLGSFVLEIVLTRVFSTLASFLIILRFWRMFRVAHSATDAAHLAANARIQALELKILELQRQLQS